MIKIFTITLDNASNNDVVRPREIPISGKRVKIVISIKKSENLFSRSRMTKTDFHRWNRLAKSSYHVEFRRIPRQSGFARFFEGIAISGAVKNNMLS